MTSSVTGLRRSSKALPKAKFASEKGHGHCLVVCCQSDPLQLSESQRNHYTWEVCSSNGWNAPKTTPAASIGQQKGPNSSSQGLTAHLIINASKVQWTGLWSVASSTIFTRHLANWLPSSSISTTFCRKKASLTSRRQKMLSKSLSNPKANIFKLQKKTNISCWQKSVDCNGSCFD